VESFLSNYSDNLDGLNWNIENQGKIKDLEKKKTKRTLDITIYLKKFKLDLFNEYSIEKVNFNIARGSSLILFHKN